MGFFFAVITDLTENTGLILDESPGNGIISGESVRSKMQYGW